MEEIVIVFKMSSNNELVIIKKRVRISNKFIYEVYLNLCVDNLFKPNKKTLLKTFKNILNAIRFAQKYCNEWPYIEYGYRFIGL